MGTWEEARKALQEKIKANPNSYTDKAMRISEALRGHKQTKETREKRSNSHTGKNQSQSQKDKVSQALKGVPKSEEAKAKMREAANHQGEKNSRYGSGVKYIEMTSKFIGTWYELIQHFGPGDYIYFAKKGNLITKGRHQGKQFQVYKEKGAE